VPGPFWLAEQQGLPIELIAADLCELNMYFSFRTENPKHFSFLTFIAVKSNRSGARITFYFFLRRIF
jgi:hypothetical protein